MGDLSPIGRGILALWHDCAPGREDLYEGWYHGEHLVERLSVPGFLAGRRYVALDGAPRYMVAYDTAGPEVLQSPAYLARLADPTPLTQRVMAEAMRGMNRTVCTRAECLGSLRGAFCVAARFGDGPAPELAETVDAELVRLERWQRAEPPGEPAQREESIRGPDVKIAHCLVAELASEPAARALLAVWRARHATAEVGGYRLVAFLGRDDL